MRQTEILKEQVKYLTDLIQEILPKNSLIEKIEILQSEYLVETFLTSDNLICSYYPELSLIEQEVVCSIAVIAQAPIVFQIPQHFSDTEGLIKKLLAQLIVIHKFYQDIGGLIGYHLKIIDLLIEKESKNYQKKSFYHPNGMHINQKSPIVDQMVIEGIKNFPKMGALFPIGGAGDRLDLKDERTKLPLPTAKLNFLGRTLLSGLIRDIQAKEYLYYKLFNKQIYTPIAMMTSEAKSNHQFITKIAEENHWYFRPKQNFFSFTQPLAPVITDQGNWSLKSPLQLYLKPSGHGVIWKIAREKGVFQWFKSLNRSKLLIRQINNPIAGVDNGILAFLGLGSSQNKAFGFASCNRLVNSAEGVNILTETKRGKNYYYAISNIEYTDFEKNGIKDEPETLDKPYSIYPSNTNILFADIEAVEKATALCTIPGMLVNMKSLVPFFNEKGERSEVHGGRLESTMQNIADYITDISPEKMDPENASCLKTFVTYNDRHKTISVTKRAYEPGQSLNETPEGCYYTTLQNNRSLLEKECHFILPDHDKPETFIKKGPSFHFLYHPALGPLYSIIKQKLRRGFIEEGSELQLEISTLDIEGLDLKGSLLIETKHPLGHLDSDQVLRYSERAGKCTLKNIQVENKGIDYKQHNCFWKNQIYRKEALKIILEENSEFEAIDVTFKGNFEIAVPKNTKMTAKMEGDQVEFEWISIKTPTWGWKYSITKTNLIHLEREML